MINVPELGSACAPHHASEETLQLLAKRRSTAAAGLRGPGPSAEDLRQMLAIAARVPDHRGVNPFRFVVFEGEARIKAGAVIAEAFKRNQPGAEDAAVAMEAKRFERAPVVVLVVASLNLAHKTPEWEQTLTAGAVCQNLLIAASASGFAAQWLTEWYAYDDEVLRAFGLGETERVAGYVYIGTAAEPPLERPRPELDALISRFAD